MTYQHNNIEPKWQKCWAQHSLFKTTETQGKPKYYVLDMFPYPSAAGLHVGHVLGYTATDIVARYYRMKGYNVLHPMGWDAFGLPAEQHAIDTGEHPAKLTYRNIDNFRRQLSALGFSYDWKREIATCDPSYYHWTQKIFQVLFEKGLAYQAEMLVNWCPALKTVLANEEVIDGKSERGGHPVMRMPMRQWMLKITAYAERLLADLDTLDWPENVKDIQRNWIGKSVGAKVRFSLVEQAQEKIEVFTTRPDTLFGATYLVLAPEHPLVTKITTEAQKNEVKTYQHTASLKSDLDRTELNKEKTGAFTGAFALHPVTGKKIPVWISDYVMMTYGTGAIMAVPGHDERDHEFARAFKLPIVQVVAPGEGSHDIQAQAYTGAGTLVNSEFLNGMSVGDAKNAMIEFLSKKELGEASTTYKFRDWLFSRQRYWGEPIPVLKDAQGNVLRAMKDDELPLTLPEVTSYEPTGDGKSPLANIASWVQRGNHFVETDTMPGSAGSSWYFLRFCDPLNTNAPFAFDKAKFWMPVDLYVGGQEHAVGHLLYSRFWTKVLFDAGICPVNEPFKKLVNQGMICRNGAKMSKSKGNGVNPDEVLEKYGADALRVYEMFMGPLTQTKEWEDSNLAGIYRFLARIERQIVDENGTSLLNDTAPTRDDLRLLHKTIKKISSDIETLSFNTSISQMMIFLNGMAESSCRSREVWSKFIPLLAPFAPHLAEELWQVCFHVKESPEHDGYPFVSMCAWPMFDESLARDDEVKIGVQINGKSRAEVTLPLDCDQDTAVRIAHEEKSLAAALATLEIKKVVFVKNRILNFVGAPK
ncbi:MAG: leucine--tRNA ligase [Betaproteobacteria bacterium]|nr:leucine--tRNA ligase [Betaproteobacteria bacterium]